MKRKAEVTAGVEERGDKGCRDLKQGKPLSACMLTTPHHTTHTHTKEVHTYYLTAHSHISSSTLQLKERGTFAPCRTMFTKVDFTRFTSRPV